MEHAFYAQPSSVFKHQPLQLSTDSIRLVKILPKISTNGRVQCRLWHDKIASKYRCLSYTWGNPSPCNVIYLNGAAFTVRSNLWNFLNEARTRPDSHEALFIDALCIDQNSLLERNHQVQIMGEIYRHATDVIVWLGSFSDSRYAAIDYTLDYIQEMYLPSLKDGKNAEDFTRYFDSLYTRSVQGESHSTTIPDVIVELCNDEYWERTWIVQEVLLARVAIIMCGQRLINMSILANFLTKGLQLKLFPEPLLSRLKMSRARVMCYWYQNRGDIRTTPNHTLRQLLAAFGGTKCSDIRDRVFALLGLANPKTTKLKADYSMTPHDLFRILVATESLFSPLDDCQLFQHTLGLSISEPVDVSITVRTLAPVTVISMDSLTPADTEGLICDYCGEKLNCFLISRMRYAAKAYGGLLPAFREVHELIEPFGLEFRSQNAAASICCLVSEQVTEHLLFKLDGNYGGFVVNEDNYFEYNDGGALDRQSGSLEKLQLDRASGVISIDECALPYFLANREHGVTRQVVSSKRAEAAAALDPSPMCTLM